MYKNKLLLLVIVFELITLSSFCQVSVTTDKTPPDSSSMLDVKSDTRGILIPRMTAAQRNAIIKPATGLMIFSTTDSVYYYNKGTTASPNWIVLNSQWKTANANIYFNSGNVGVGNAAPNSLLSVGKNNQLQVDSNGNIIRINNVPFRWPSNQGVPNANLQNNGSGNLSWVADSLKVSAAGDMLTLTPGNSVYIPGISNANSSIPIVTTDTVTNITATRAYGRGAVIFYGVNIITETGICWSLNQPPTIADNYVPSGAFSGSFICIMNGLTANTVYFARAYAKTAGNTYYGETVVFNTPDILPVPTLTTTEVSGITTVAALSGGFISSNGGAAVTARGVCWSTVPSPTIANSLTSNGTGNGLFTSYMTGLTLNTLYYVRAYATNANGTNYGPELFFTTSGVVPTVITTAPTGVAASAAILGGNVTAQGSSAVTDRGVCYSTSANPSITDNKFAVGSGTGNFSAANALLIPNTLYHMRAYATNSVGTGYGQDLTFTTLNAYYEGFENGYPITWSGIGWAVSTIAPYQNYFCLLSNKTSDSVSFTRTVTSSPNGNMSFYYHGSYFNSFTITTTQFYIDNVLQATLSGESAVWTLHSYSIPAGTHTFKWINRGWTASPSGLGSPNVYIDYINVSP